MSSWPMQSRGEPSLVPRNLTFLNTAQTTLRTTPRTPGQSAVRIAISTARATAKLLPAATWQRARFMKTANRPRGSSSLQPLPLRDLGRLAPILNSCHRQGVRRHRPSPPCRVHPQVPPRHQTQHHPSLRANGAPRPVSYTHLDVYKRQGLHRPEKNAPEPRIDLFPPPKQKPRPKLKQRQKPERACRNPRPPARPRLPVPKQIGGPAPMLGLGRRPNRNVASAS